MHLFLLILLYVLLHISTLGYNTNDSNHTIMQPEKITKPGCQRKCGNVTVPYPFGIISEGLNCSINPFFDITCDNSFNPPKAFIQTTNFQVYDISDTEVRIFNLLSYKCYDQSGGAVEEKTFGSSLYETPYVYSDANVLVVVGCDDYANLFNAPKSILPKGCITTCQNTDEIRENECSGSGCCQVSINLEKYFFLKHGSFNQHKNVSSFNSCGYTFFGEKSRFKFGGKSDLNALTFQNRIVNNVPIVLDWFIGDKNCTEAVQDSNSYACIDPNSECVNGGTRSCWIIKLNSSIAEEYSGKLHTVNVWEYIKSLC